MSRITKSVCDNCGNEIDYNEWYYSVGDIIEKNESCENGELILKGGDFCRTCYNNIIAINRNEIKK